MLWERRSGTIFHLDLCNVVGRVDPFFAEAARAQRNRVALTALKTVPPVMMLFPAPNARASPGIRTISIDWHFGHGLELRMIALVSVMWGEQRS
jgi:hypothetical protein